VQLEPRERPSAAHAARLPAWITSFPSRGNDGPVAETRERTLHPHGSSELWEQISAPESTLCYRVGWRDGTGALRTLPATELSLGIPEDLARRATKLTARVSVPGIEYDWGTAWRYEATTPEACVAALRDVPDGTLTASLVLDDGSVLASKAAIVDGRFADGAPRWRPLDAPATENVVEARAAPADTAGVAVTAALAAVRAEPWTLGRLSSVLGVDVAALAFSDIAFLGLPTGDVVTARGTGDVSFDLPSGSFVELQVQDMRRTLWGLVTSGEREVLPAASARIAILNRGGQRTVHITLPRAELRLALAPGDVSEISVRAPVDVFLLSVVKVGEQEDRAAEEGMGIGVRANDVLVVEYD
jgi:hypothetical protein